MDEKLVIKRGQCSFYENVKSKRNTVITLAQFVTMIRSDRWKQPVQDYRRCMEEQRQAEAKVIKEGMPGLIVAGVCEGGHKKENVRSLSGFLMIDIDHYEGNVHDLLNRIRKFPWAAAGWVSISGEGVKAVIRADAATKDEYEKRVYPTVAAYLMRTLDTPVDKQCRDLSRTCYASYDPDAFYKEDVVPFPWQEEAEAPAAESTEHAAENLAEKAGKSTGKPVSGIIANFLEHFIYRNPYVPGRRHQFHLALGREARFVNMNEEDLAQLISLSESRLAMPDCDAAEIRRNITDGYRFSEKDPSLEIRQFRAKAHWAHLALPTPSPQESEEEEEKAEITTHNRLMSLGAPCLPDWIFDRLPPLFQEGLKVAKNRRQRDMLFLGMLTNLSGCLPNVRMRYDDDYIYPHLFLAVIASSATGKGILAQAAKLGRFVQKMFDEEHEKKKREYTEAMMLWEQEYAEARKAKRKANHDLCPKPLGRQTLMVPADISRVQLIQLMSTSPQGLLLNVSEMDTLRAANNAEYGRFDDILRACFHHEMFGTDFKGDKQAYIVDCAKLAFCASGTPAQFYRLCPSTENGSYSRYSIYLAEQDIHFRSMAPGDESVNKYTVFRRLGEKVLKMYRYLKANPTDVLFTPGQWDYHRSYFEAALQEVKLEGGDTPESVVLRGGLMSARIAMILTALRKFDAQWEFYDVTCTEEDFGIAMAVIEVLMKHSLMFSTTMRKEKMVISRMRSTDEIRKALESLPAQGFTYTELINAMESQGVPHTARRRRQMLLKMEVIVQEGDKYRLSSDSWQKILQKGRG